MGSEEAEAVTVAQVVAPDFHCEQWETTVVTRGKQEMPCVCLHLDSGERNCSKSSLKTT